MNSAIAHDAQIYISSVVTMVIPIMENIGQVRHHPNFTIVIVAFNGLERIFERINVTEPECVDAGHDL